MADLARADSAIQESPLSPAGAFRFHDVGEDIVDARQVAASETIRIISSPYSSSLYAWTTGSTASISGSQRKFTPFTNRIENVTVGEASNKTVLRYRW